jgi:rSAM/selenodomain-associated transferase 1
MTSSAARPEAVRIAVFAKAPVPGAVKTRLVATLGADAAAGLHARLVRHALATALESGIGPVELWCAPDTSDAFFDQCAREFGVALKRQQGADLGVRMGHAINATLALGAALVIIGSDCPAMAPAHLHGARDALRSRDVVIAPAEDGGYVLVGQSAPVAGLFDDIPWGSDAVMERTRARLAGSGATWQELATLWDIDRPEDYARWMREGAAGLAS